MPRTEPTEREIAAAVRVLCRAGFALHGPERAAPGALSVARAAAFLGCSRDWVRDHLSEFPHAFLLGSDYRIPQRDLERYARARIVQSTP